MRWMMVGIGALALGACSKAPDGTASGGKAGPDIAVTAAPGVAFSYRYAFALPSQAIAGAQEGHAQACEKLGVARCRVTGMRYQLLGENDVQAMLALKLDPALARAFGRNGIAAIEAAKGQLVDAEITGTDAAAAIAAAQTDRAAQDAEVERIDDTSARSVGAAARGALEQQRAETRQRALAAAREAAEGRASLAATPVTFEYRSGAAIRGFDPSAPLTSALDTGVASAQMTLAAMLGLFAIFGPPALVALLGWLAWRALRRRFVRMTGTAPI